MQLKHLLLFLIVMVGLGQNLNVKANLPEAQVTTTIIGGVSPRITGSVFAAGIISSFLTGYYQKGCEALVATSFIGSVLSFIASAVSPLTKITKKTYPARTQVYDVLPGEYHTIFVGGRITSADYDVSSRKVTLNYGKISTEYWDTGSELKLLLARLIALPLVNHLSYRWGMQNSNDRVIYESYGLTPGGKFLAEARFGNVEKVEYWLGQGIAVNSCDPFDNTALMLAAQYGHYQVVDLLLQRGANEDLANKDHKTAYILARNEFRKTRKKVYHTIMRLIIEWPRKRQKIYNAMDKEYEAINQQEQRTVFPKGLRTVISKYVI